MAQPPESFSHTPDPPELGAAADRLMALVDDVVAQTESVRARVKEVERSLDALSRQISAPAEATPSPIAPEPIAPEAADEDQTSDTARLMAIEMAVSGSSRREVAERLIGDFGVANPAPILDDVFGAGSADDSRMPWST